MTTRTVPMTDALYGYLAATLPPEPELLQDLRTETARLGDIVRMQIAPEQARFMAVLVRLMGARRVLEIGTFTGYSTITMALAMPEDGRIVACDTSEEWTAIARRFWEAAGVAGKIDLRLAPARDTLADLRAAGGDGTFDLSFIDADKENQHHYYEDSLALLRPGGVVLVDNALWSGAVADPARQDASTVAIRALNAAVRDDPRVDPCLLPVGDGVLMACKR
jgi:caffeoyl-CoA O-methyltransferase